MTHFVSAFPTCSQVNHHTHTHTHTHVHMHFLSPKLFFLFMYICLVLICVYMCVCMWIHTYVCGWVPKHKLDVCMKTRLCCSGESPDYFSRLLTRLYVGSGDQNTISLACTRDLSTDPSPQTLQHLIHALMMARYSSSQV